MTEKTFEEKLQEMTIEELKESLEYWEKEHFRMQCADDFYYSNGGWSSTERTIDAYRAEIRKREGENK